MKSRRNYDTELKTEPKEEVVETVKEKVEEKKNNVISKITTDNVNIRKEPTIYSERVGSVGANCVIKLSEITEDNWGKLVNGKGYICLDYARDL